MRIHQSCEFPHSSVNRIGEDVADDRCLSIHANSKLTSREEEEEEATTDNNRQLGWLLLSMFFWEREANFTLLGWFRVAWNWKWNKLNKAKDKQQIMSASFGFVEPKWPTTKTTTTRRRIRRRESFFDIFSVRICQPQDRHRKHNIHTPVVGSGSSKPNKRKKRTFLLLFLYFPQGEEREREKKKEAKRT